MEARCGQQSVPTSSPFRENSSRAQRKVIKGIQGTWVRKWALGSGRGLFPLIILFRGIPDNPQKGDWYGREVIPGWFLSAHNIQWLMGPGTPKTPGAGLSMNRRCLHPSPRDPKSDRPKQPPQPGVNATMRTT